MRTTVWQPIFQPPYKCMNGLERWRVLLAVITSTFAAWPGLGSTADLRVGIAGHAFDHLGGIGEQGNVAAQAGANIIYVSGVGTFGYQGLPDEAEMARQKQLAARYVSEVKQNGIRLAIGYVCATSMVDLETFDRHWTPSLRQQFRTAPAEWRQQDKHGNILRSWYGGNYEAACMSNPDWRAYERLIVRHQLEAGCDGIFFDNPTVHPEGCYCEWCMKAFRHFVEGEGLIPPANGRKQVRTVAEMREMAATNRETFLKFRCTIARDFLKEMREFARKVKPGALLTANNSLNSAEVLYSQCRSYAYNIYEMSRVEDLVVVEDMSSQPRTLTNGKTIEYGPMYQQLHAISHGKPVVAVTLADADYHTPPNLVRLAMAEAAANRASYLAWPTWPESQRDRMVSAIRPEADFLVRNQKLDGVPRQDVVVFLPFRNWIDTGDCKASRLTTELCRANVPYEVICEDDLKQFLTAAAHRQKHGVSAAKESRDLSGKVLVAEARSVFQPEEEKLLENFLLKGGTLITTENPDWKEKARAVSSVVLEGPESVRVRIYDEPHRTVIHLLNLHVQKLSSFEDKVIPATRIGLKVRVPFKKPKSMRVLTPDTEGSSGPLEFTGSVDEIQGQTKVAAEIGRVQISAVVVVE